MEAHEKHQQDLIAAFGELVQAEKEAAGIKTEADEAAAKFGAALRAVETRISDAWLKIENLLAETGEVSVILPGAVADYEIYRTTPRESVKVLDVDALPEKFVRIKREPDKKAIGEELKALRDAGQAMPNYATLEVGESKLAWRAKKKTTKE